MHVRHVQHENIQMHQGQSTTRIQIVVVMFHVDVIERHEQRVHVQINV